ncbi:MAG: DUF1028 domain-containing protein [Candidatus Limnocylindrales bacterium]
MHREEALVVTYSIVARDGVTGDLGVAVQSRFLAVGSVVPWARAGVGAIATQSYANVGYGPDGLALLAGGSDAEDTLAALVELDQLRAQRQAGVVDAHGGSASYTGRSCFAWAGGRTGPGYAAQGNILAGAAVVDALADTFEAGSLPFPELLVACLAAADAAGGDRRGRQSAALLVVREGGGYGGGNDRWIDLRVDDHADPVAELARLLDLTHLYMERPTPAELIALDVPLAGELRDALGRLGWDPATAGSSHFVPMWPDEVEAEQERPFTGDPRPLPDGWDAAWQERLLAWMAVENLEERTAAPGWIDPKVLAHLRGAARGR